MTLLKGNVLVQSAPNTSDTALVEAKVIEVSAVGVNPAIVVGKTVVVDRYAISRIYGHPADLGIVNTGDVRSIL